MHRAKKIFGVLLLLSFIWGAIFLINVIRHTSTNNNQYYVPNESTTYILVDGQQLISEAFEEIILQEEDETLLKQLLVSLKEKDEQATKKLGIDLQSNVIVFTYPYQGIKLTGILLNLLNKDSFDKHFSGSANQSQYSASNDDKVGLILFQPSKNKKDLSELAASILGKRKKSIIDANVEGISKIYFGDGFVNLSTEKNKLLFNGKIDLVKHFNHQLGQRETTVMDGKGISFQSQLIPKSVQDSLISIFGDTLPHLSSFSASISALELVESPVIRVIPHGNFLFNFEAPVQLKTILDSLETTGDITSLTEQSFAYGEVHFHYTQLDSSQVYFGVDRFEDAQTVRKDHLLSLEGNPKVLSHITGNGIIRRMMEILPIFRATKNGTSSIENLQFKMDLEDDFKGLIHGEIIFKEGKHPFSSILKFALEGQLIK